MIKIRSIYSERKPHEYAFKTEGESMTQQQFQAECDINNIMVKYRKTGLLTHVNKVQGNYGDFESVEDYQTMLGKVMHAEATFMDLPSEIRAKFGNDPAQLIGYLTDEKNYDEAVSYGLIIPKKSEDPLADSFEKALDKHEAKKSKSPEQK